MHDALHPNLALIHESGLDVYSSKRNEQCNTQTSRMYVMITNVYQLSRRQKMLSAKVYAIMTFWFRLQSGREGNNIILHYVCKQF